MSFAGIGLLLGLFAAPAILLQLGHRLRHRSDRNKRMFWSGLIGHSIGACISMIALMAPPIMWQDGTARILVAHWGMVIGFAVGLLFGALTFSERSRAR